MAREGGWSANMVLLMYFLQLESFGYIIAQMFYICKPERRREKACLFLVVIRSRHPAGGGFAQPSTKWIFRSRHAVDPTGLTERKRIGRD